MTAALEAIEDLKRLSDGLHWFCPRKYNDDQTAYFEEDLKAADLAAESADDKKRREREIANAKHRRRKVFEALQILAYDGDDAVAPQKWILQKLEWYMGACDVCVRTFHTSRTELRESLDAEYEEDEVAAFMDKVDGINVERIKDGLFHAERQLNHISDLRQRRIASLDTKGVYALFEAMNCEPFLRNEQLLRDHFDKPFELVQTNRKLRLPTYLPAFTYFLFSTERSRREWAVHAWMKSDRPPNSHEWDTMMRKPLHLASLRVQMTSLELGFLPTFWSGMRIMVSTISDELMVNSLRPMDPNVHRLALDHFHLKEIDPATFGDLATTFKVMLEKSPAAFWDSMRSIPPQAVIEQVFRSPALAHLLMRPDDEGMPTLETAFAWTTPFLRSIKGNKAAACATLTRELINRSKTDSFDSAAAAYCFTVALHVLRETLLGVNRPSDLDSYVGSAVAADVLEQVTQHLDLICSQARGVKNDAKLSEETAMALSVVENAVALDCLTLAMDRAAIEDRRARGPTAPKSSALFWAQLNKGTALSDQALATRALLGAQRLVSLESFGAKARGRSPEDTKQFNEIFQEKCGQVSGYVEKISDFPPFQLAGFFKTPDTALAIVQLTICSNLAIRQSAVELLKSASEKTGRLEAITDILNSAYHSFLGAFNKSISSVCAQRVFTPMPGIIKLCTDVIETLCNSSTGILRMKRLVEEELEATKEFWKALWNVLATIFETMETWGVGDYDKQFMMNFCRDTMEFADRLFDQYSVFVNALHDDEYEDEKTNVEQAKSLLRFPRDTMGDMVKWLRLKDEYLVQCIVTLVTSLLARLSKSNVDATGAALDFIEGVVTGEIKSALNGNQKAQLLDALEKFTHRRTAVLAAEEKKKKAKQTSLNEWATTGRSREDAIDLDSGSDSVRKTLVTGRADRKAEQKKAMLSKKPVPAARRNVIDQAEFLRKRKAAEEEARKKRMEAAAAARGNMPGSALNSVGLATKDHSKKGEGVMVDSDDESEESSDEEQDELDRELFGATAKKHSQPANAMSDEAAKRLLEQQQRRPVKVKKIQRSAKDMRARLAPDLTKLHQEILSWDYFHDGYYPPNSREEMYTRVPNVIEDAATYRKVFQPLLVLETWRKICSDKEQDSTTRPIEVKVTSRASVDAFYEVNTSILQSEQKLEVSEGDLCLLSMARNPRESRDSPSCLGRIHRVQRKKQHVEILYRVVPGNKFLSSLTGGNSIRSLKIESLITVEREYGALIGLQYYDLCEYVLNAAPSSLLTYTDAQLRSLMENYRLNQAQARAVKSALDNDAFTLIQGPPGSGKTKTIVATVGALLTNSWKGGSAAPATAIGRPGATNGVPAGGSTSKKLLVCAPSNAAVDELVLRFKEGIKLSDGREKKVNVVRLGRSEKINPQVVEVTLEDLVAKRIDKGTGTNEAQRQETHKLMQEHKELSQKLNAAHDRMSSKEGQGPKASEIQTDIDNMRRRRKELGMLIDQAKDKESTTTRQNDLERKRVEQAVLDEAHILCATLSASGHDRFQNLSLEFETVIVDEAAQCTELQALIPLKYGCAKCILVGDPKQLPPTTFMDKKLNLQYEQSLFVRMQNNSPKDVHLLDTQYRMHPEISSFPSKCFYDGRLLDGEGMAKLREAPWHKDPILGPYRFFDVQGFQTSSGSSLTNKMEIDAAMQLVDKLMDANPKYDFKGKIGIITPYKAQFNALKRQFIEIYGKGIVDTIEFNTTDAFQGRECEIIIFSCVRASEGSIGFLNDYRRMNVGLTRAKYSLWVLGNTRSLVNGKDWRAMIEDAQSRNRISPSADIRGNKRQPGYRPVPPPPAGPALDYDGDTSMRNGASSAGESRRSSFSSMAVNGRPVPTGPAKDSAATSNSRSVPTGPRATKVLGPHADIKSEPVNIKSETTEVDMKDIFPDGDSEDEDYEPSMLLKPEDAKSESIKAEKLPVKQEMEPPKGPKGFEVPPLPPPPGAPRSYANQSPIVPPPRNGAGGQMHPRPVPGKRKKAPANPLMDSKRPRK